jgi:alpha-tubulin suppressor-like RCC1 family protein
MKRSIFFNALCALLLFLSFTLNTSAQALGWGESKLSLLGFTTTTDYFPTPQIIPALPDTTGMDGGDFYTVFLRANGKVAVSGGSPYDGVWGIGTVFETPVFPVAPLNLTDIIQVTGGASFSLALKSDGTVWAWGRNDYGKLGVPSLNTSATVYAPVQSAISDVVQISTGPSHSLALKSDGTVWAWGNNHWGQGANTNENGRPQRVGTLVPRFRNLIAVSGGEFISAAVKDDGTVWVWGNNNNGLYGDGTNILDNWESNKPRIIPGLNDVVQISAGVYHIAALKRDGTVWVWGTNPHGLCGTGTLRDFRFEIGSAINRDKLPCLSPNKVNISDVVEIKSSDYHIVARKRDGSVWVWGLNLDGQLGNDTSPANSLYYASPVPVQSFAGTGNALIGTGSRSSFAVKPVIETPAGFGVRHYGENVNLLFSNVVAAGVTSYTAIDPTATNLNVPQGLAIQPNDPAYNITTTAHTSGETEVCVKVNEYSRAEFSFLKILSAEGSDWIDRTSSTDYIRRQVCARVDSLSSFVIAKPVSAITNYTKSSR